jgi:hypothetical protein
VTDPCPDCPHRDATPSPPHAPDSPRRQPPPRGPGSTEAHRAQVMARIRREIDQAKRRAAGGTP